MVVLFGVAITLIGLVVLPWGVVHAFQSFRAAPSMVRTHGVVVELREVHREWTQMGRAQGSSYYPVVEIAGPAGLIRFVSAFGSRPSLYRLRQRVRVCYPAGNPNGAEIDTVVHSLMPGVPVVIGAVFLLVGPAVLVGTYLWWTGR